MAKLNLFFHTIVFFCTFRKNFNAYGTFEEEKEFLMQAEHQAMFHALQNNDYAACEAAIDRHYDYVDAELSKSSK